MTLAPALSAIQSQQAFREVLDALGSPRAQHISLGLMRSARLPVLAALYRARPAPLILVSDRTDYALKLADELSLWLPDAPRCFFPEPNPLFYENAAWGVTTRRDRLLALTALAARQIPAAEAKTAAPPVIVAPARALMTRTLPRRAFIKAAHTLRTGQIVQPGELARRWVRLGYEPASVVIAPGQFARRGGILDIWPPADPAPARIDFFGDEVDTLRRFDPATQRTTAPLERLLITPAREFVADGGWRMADGKWQMADGERQTTDHRPLTTDRGQPSQPSTFNLETPTEFHLPLIHPAPASLLDYLPRDGLVLIENRETVFAAVDELEEQALELRREAAADGTIPEDFPRPYLTRDEIEDSLPPGRTVFLGPVSSERQMVDGEWQGADGEWQMADGEQPTTDDRPLTTDRAQPSAARRQRPVFSLQRQFIPNPRFGGQLRQVMTYLAENLAASPPTLPSPRPPTQTLPPVGGGQGGGTEDEQISLIIVSRQVSRLEELWREQHPPQSRAAAPPRFVRGSLGDGWTLLGDDGSRLHLLTDGEIFGWRRPQPRHRQRPVAEAPEAAYADLQPGDWVVHADHGIGRFAGLVRRTIERAERDYLCIEYADGDQLFVPVHQADRLTRYVGPDGREPAPTRLGGAAWSRVRGRVREAVQEMAEELLELYARRNVVQGHAFSPDTPWQAELEGSFPYIETEDQLRVLAEVKRDMEAPRPMDRLVCGDVGFGKTEIALRAAFKAVMDGKQVAVLVPTTVLAQQHYQTFRRRMAAFPVTVEMLSRFRTPAQQRKILLGLAAGAVDIVIGTHRLLSGDVVFKDLGLLIIDEEQRFGVSHKETLKRMRTEVDVLTMTATPIPRTLYLTLTGVRDISTINTPPEERLPIVTHVGPYNPKLVRRAVLRELERGGQVFFVHNRVQTIEGMRAHLERLVPEARIGVAHGQMPEGQLAARMRAFSAGEIDLLLSTTIIESGLDIPNANTLIVDRADTFGLAQLYQLRGRVGRGAQRAYAYFFKHPRRRPTAEAAERLETLAENTQLGAGFNIAMRDLEIRGAGDILGSRQHGHVAAVGFHLYTRLLADAIQHLQGVRGETPKRDDLLRSIHRPLVSVDLPLDTHIPPEYVPDQTTRLGLYRRIADAAALDEMDALAEEFADRFGPLPASVENLLFQMRVKILAERAGLSAVSFEGGQMVLRFPEGEKPPSEAGFPPRVRVGKSALWVRVNPEEDWRGVLTGLLKMI